MACRYGHVTVTDIMEMPVSDMLEFTKSVGELIGQENKTHESD